MSLPEVREVFEAMPRVDALVRHPRFACGLARLEELERDRPWCRHGLPHLLDVARIMWIAALEHGWAAPMGCGARDVPAGGCGVPTAAAADGAPASVAGAATDARATCATAAVACAGGAAAPPFARDVVYATALLHDMGRVAQYETGEPHHAAGQRYARELLGSLADPVRFTASEIDAIARAVGAHRSGGAHAAAGPAAATLAGLLRASDKAARACWACAARATCCWPPEKMNETLRV